MGSEQQDSSELLPSTPALELFIHESRISGGKEVIIKSQDIARPWLAAGEELFEAINRCFG